MSATSREVSILLMGRFEYAFAQAQKNIFRNGLMTVASLFTIASCLVILGIFLIMTINAKYISDQIKEQCDIQVFLDVDTSEKRVEAIGEELSSVANVRSVELFTKADMLEYAENDIFEGRSDLSLGLEDDNPFSDSYKITLNNIDLARETVKEIEILKNVDHVVNNQDFIDIVSYVSKSVQKFSLIIMALLLVIAIVIISNTIKLTVFNRRKEINIMKYIGATDRFIRVPFIIEGITIGILGAAVSFGLVSWGYNALYALFESSQFDMISIISYNKIWIPLAVLFTLVGGTIGMFGSIISMRKYLKV